MEKTVSFVQQRPLSEYNSSQNAAEGHQDVRHGLAAVKRGVLEGCSLVLSRAFNRMHPLWRLAEEVIASTVIRNPEPHR
eukprot:scaffold43924_cov18-Prasinocladus_malaysianus.AAC.1